MYSFTEENYLKTIYKLSELHSKNISTNSIAQIIQTKAASVTDMVKRLSDKKLIRYEKYKGVSLTEKGKKVALDTIRKHRIWESFLHTKLKFGWDEVHEIAEQLEHIKSEVLIDRLDEFLGFPTRDPHGDPIPSKTGSIPKNTYKILADMMEDEQVVMNGVLDHSPIFLQYLSKLKLEIGTVLLIIEKIEYDNSMTVKINGKTVQLSNNVTQNILVIPDARK